MYFKRSEIVWVATVFQQEGDFNMEFVISTIQNSHASCDRNRQLKKVNRKVQGVPQSQAAANPCHKEEEKKDRNYHKCMQN